MKNILGRFSLIIPFILGLTLLSSQLLIVAPAYAQTASDLSVGVKASLQLQQKLGLATCAQPPATSDLLTLTDAQLMFYGFPTHATLDANPDYWNAKLSYAKHRNCGTTSDPSHIVHHFAPTPGSNVSQRNSYNWAGNVAYGSRGTYTQASVEFVVPKITGSNSHVSFWAGIGGDPDYTTPDVLVQAGVDISLGSSGGQYNESWWEVYPYNTEQNLPLSRLNTGDTVYVFVTSNDSNDGYDEFFIENETTGYYNSYINYTTNYFSDSATGECIGERPTYNGSYPALSNFGTEELNYCYVASGGHDQGIQNWSHDYYEMINSSGKQLATVGSITNGSNYPIYWKAAS